MTKLPELTDDTIDDFLSKNPIVVIDFWAPWCGPCKTMEPIIEKLATKYENEIAFAKVNSDENMEIALRYKIMNLPRFLIFQDGEVIGEIKGSHPLSKFDKLLNEQLEK